MLRSAAIVILSLALAIPALAGEFIEDPVEGQLKMQDRQWVFVSRSQVYRVGIETEVVDHEGRSVSLREVMPGRRALLHSWAPAILGSLPTAEMIAIEAPH